MPSSSHISHLRPAGEGMDRPVARPKNRRRWIIAGVAAGMAVVAGAAFWLLPSAGSLALKRADVEIAEVRREPFQDYLPIRAEVAPLTTVFVTAIEGGQVEQVAAQDGAEVAAGAP